MLNVNKFHFETRKCATISEKTKWNFSFISHWLSCSTSGGTWKYDKILSAFHQYGTIDHRHTHTLRWRYEMYNQQSELPPTHKANGQSSGLVVMLPLLSLAIPSNATTTFEICVAHCWNWSSRRMWCWMFTLLFRSARSAYAQMYTYARYISHTNFGVKNFSYLHIVMEIETVRLAYR